MKKKIITYLQLHLLELKYNCFFFSLLFIYLFSICFFFSDQLIYLFVKKLLQYQVLKHFIFTNITEFFLTNLFFSLFVSSLISIQFLFIQTWFFFSKGFYQFENLKILRFYMFYFFFNLCIITLIFLIIIPNIWCFFAQMPFSNKFLFQIYFEPKLDTYFWFVFTSFIYIYLFLFYFFILFFFILNNILKIQTVIHLRKFFYFQFILIATFISPPDIFSQLIISLSFISSFEILIYMYIYKYIY